MPRTIKRKDRDLLHQALVADSAMTATALGDALIGGERATGRMLRERLEAELRLLDDFAWAARQPARETFELTLSDEQLARTLQRLARRGTERLTALADRRREERIAAGDERDDDDIDLIAAEIDRDDPERDGEAHVVMLSHYLLRDVPLHVVRAAVAPREA
jgi:hypothetical protein